jgi:hypothetical protein
MNRIVTIVLLAFCVTGFARENSPSDITLQDQFQTLRSQAEVVESFRMLKAYQVENFWKSVQDTIRQKDAALLAVQKQIALHAAERNALQAQIDTKESTLADLKFAGTHIAVWNWHINKGKFTKSVGIGFIALIVLSGVAFIFCKVSYQNARESRTLYNDVRDDYEAYKQRMVEKEVKLLRELQDYRNRLVELKSA